MFESLYYPVCSCCKKVVKELKFGLCDSCLDSLLNNRYRSRCRYCSYPVNEGSNICGRCFNNTLWFEKGFFLFPYNDCGRALIHNIKFRDKIEYIEIIYSFKKEVLNFLEDCDLDVITYIPSSFFHYLKRGYTVPKKVGGIISDLSSVPVKKLVFTSRPFKKLLSKSKNVSERKAIVSNFFKVRSSRGYQGVLLVDDVFTTGTTMNTVSRLLKRENIAKKVYFLTLSMVIDK